MIEAIIARDGFFIAGGVVTVVILFLAGIHFARRAVRGY